MVGQVSLIVSLLCVVPGVALYTMQMFMPGDYLSMSVNLLPYLTAVVLKALPLPFPKWLYLSPLEIKLTEYSKKTLSMNTNLSSSGEIPVIKLFEYVHVDKFAELKIGKKDTAKLITDIEDRLLQGILPVVGVTIMMIIFSYISCLLDKNISSGAFTNSTSKEIGSLTKIVVSIFTSMLVFSRIVLFVGDRRKKNAELLQ